MAIPMLWRNLTASEQRELSRRFIRLSPDQLSALGEEEFCLFAQWLYGRSFKLMASNVVDCAGGFDFTYEFPDGSKEFLRVYPNERVPIAMLHDVLMTAEGHSYKKLRIYMRAIRPKAASQLEREFPLTFEVIDLDRLRRRLADEQRRYDLEKIAKVRPAPSRSLRDRLRSFFGLNKLR